MADELDRLLDEVERRLCHRHGGGEEEPAAAEEGRSAKVLMSAGSSEDLDDIIDEICNDSSFTRTPPKLKSNSASLTPESSSVVVQAHRKRCCPVYLGGSLSPSGIGTNISKRACDQLRCTACDFRVSLFNDYIWDQSCDYLFFRNNMPELSKLRAKMIKKKGARAYACQCSWRSIDELTDLQTQQQLRGDSCVCRPLKEQISVVTSCTLHPAYLVLPRVLVLEPAEAQQCAWEAWQCFFSAPDCTFQCPTQPCCRIRVMLQTTPKSSDEKKERLFFQKS